MGVRGLGFRRGLRQAVWSPAVARGSCAATMELVLAFLVPVSTQSASEAVCVLDGLGYSCCPAPARVHWGNEL